MAALDLDTQAPCRRLWPGLHKCAGSLYHRSEPRYKLPCSLMRNVTELVFCQRGGQRNHHRIGDDQERPDSVGSPCGFALLVFDKLEFPYYVVVAVQNWDLTPGQISDEYGLREAQVKEALAF